MVAAPRKPSGEMPLPAITHSRKHERPKNEPVDYLVEHGVHKVCYYDWQRPKGGLSHGRVVQN